MKICHLKYFLIICVFFHLQQFDNVNERAQVNFVGTICKYVSAPQPRICNAHNGASTPSLASVSAILSSLLGLWFLRLFC